MRYDDRPDPLIALHSGAVARSRDSFARWLDEPAAEPEKKDDTVRWVDPQLAGVASDLKHPSAPQPRYFSGLVTDKDPQGVCIWVLEPGKPMPAPAIERTREEYEAFMAAQAAEHNARVAAAIQQAATDAAVSGTGVLRVGVDLAKPGGDVSAVVLATLKGKHLTVREMILDDWFAVGKVVDVPSFGISGKLTRLEGRHAVVATDAGNGESMTYYVFREQCRPASPAVRYLEDDRQMREACL